MNQNSFREPQGRLVEVDGVQYQLIDGRLHRYADLTLDKGFKIVLGRIGSERILMNMLNWAQKYFNKRAVYYSSAF
jgi:hypothetical protein